jgi:hypothetical protein
MPPLPLVDHRDEQRQLASDLIMTSVMNDHV